MTTRAILHPTIIATLTPVPMLLEELASLSPFSSKDGVRHGPLRALLERNSKTSDSPAVTLHKIAVVRRGNQRNMVISHAEIIAEQF